MSTTDIAIVGIGCRFPTDTVDPSSLWTQLLAARNEAREVPSSRWNAERFAADDRATPGRAHVRYGHFLAQDPFAFDGAFFGIPPRAAAELDPQQRLLMEVAWEALDDAGRPAGSLAGSDTGVFVGGFSLDARTLRESELNRHELTSDSAYGLSLTVLASRLSYLLDLRGPSLAIDTACSSSLVAVDLAVDALRRGTCSAALVGGANAMIWPHTSVVMSKAGFLAPDGRSKAFDASGDGYGRAEGAGIVLLVPLEEAVARGDRIYAVIRATGTNQDGRTKGMAVPCGDAQERLARRVCAEAGIEPSTIDYVEAHGTGTPTGDPIEARSLGSVFGAERDRPLWLGSIKANIGHCEAAAGVAGLIKAALVLHHGVVPAHPLPTGANPDIPFSELGLSLPARTEPLSRPADRPLRAAVNSFGYGGTNAHVVLEAAPPSPVVSASSGGPLLLALSARSEAALTQLRDRYAHHLAANPQAAPAVCAAAATRRDAHRCRLTAAGADIDELLASLSGAPPTTHRSAPRVAFVYSGMGPQWAGMGRRLFADDPVAAEQLQAFDAHFAPLAGWSLAEALASDDAERMARTDVAQPTSVALQLAVAARLAAWGVRPEVVVGHSVGEIAAAVHAGLYDLPTAATVATHRSRLQHLTAGTGALLAVDLPDDVLDAVLATFGSDVCIAARNSPTAAALAGPRDVLAHLETLLQEEGYFARVLRVDVPYHSPGMDPIRQPLLDALAEVRAESPTCPIWSTVTASEVAEGDFDAAYWWRNVREPVAFADTVRGLLAQGIDTFVEIGAHPVLGAYLSALAAEAGVSATVIGTLRRHGDDARQLDEVLGRLFEAGAPVDFDARFPDARTVDLPSYPWQRERHWSESAASATLRSAPLPHPLLDQAVPDAGHAWLARPQATHPRWLADHVIDGAVVLPGAALVDMAVGAARAAGQQGPLEVVDVQFERVTVLDGPVTLRVAYDPDRRRATVHDTDGDELLASLRVYAARSEGAVVPLPEVPAGATEAAEAAQRLFGRRGMHYGEAFRGLSAWWGTPDDVHAELQLPEGLDGTAHDLHPAMLDAALQALLVPVLRDTPGVRVLPVGIDRLQLLGEVPPTVRLVGRVDGDGERERTARLSLVHPQTGEVVVRLTGLRCRLLPTATDAASAGHFLTEWTEVALRDAGAEPAVIGADDTDDPVAAAAALQVALVWAIDAGQPAVVLTRGAWALDDDDVCPRPVAAVRAGIVRTAANEGHPVRLVDLPRDRDEDQAFIEAALASDQPELALRGGRALARQVVLAEPPQPVAPSQRPASEVDGWELVLDDGRWALHEVARRAPDAGELQVALDYASLNFKDLLKAANRLDARALQGTFFGASLGMEACGRVVAVGADVERYRVGDPVVLVHPGALASHLTLRQEWVAPAVPHLGAAQAAAPIAMLTATMALDDLARLQPGERVLIHQATGGVGRCALAIAQRRGARIFATAGTEAKRALLREEGVAVGDSRSHDFVADVLAWSDGEGVDVALCALDRTGLDRTVDAMARFGRLIDIGKDAQVSDHALGLRPFHKALSYIAFDLDQVFEHQPERAHRAVERVQEALRTEALPPPPVTVFDLDHVAEAFDRFRAPDHTGKIVLDLSAGDRPVRCAQARHPALRADGTYLVTGGLDGFGAELVRWLARHGAGAVVAASRRGPDAPQAGPLAEQVEQHGARFVALALDVADRDAGPAPSTPCAAPTCRRCGACSTGRWCSTTAPWSTTTPRPTPACSVPSCSGRCTSTR